jgi:pimeloyl-ACP methyl ester carboxylesterase
MAYMDSARPITMLLIHGFPLSSAMWLPQLEELTEMVRIIAPDLRGHGASDATPPPYDMETYADDCINLLDSLGITDPIVIGGLSMGGYIAFEIYRRYPERVLGLVLAATRAGDDSAEGRQGREQAAAGVRANGVQPLVDGMIPKLMAPATLANDAELVAFIREVMSSNSAEGVEGALYAMRDRSDSTALLPLIDVPTLVIHGAEDQLMPPDGAKAMAEAIPGARFVLLPDAGHLPNLEQSEAFNNALADFLLSLLPDDDE